MSWTCQRQSDGARCGFLNENRYRNCRLCGKPKRPKRVPKHRAVLATMPYSEWVAKYGETCNLCGATRKTRRLQRDHDHGSGLDRGVLCSRCNRALPAWMTANWLRRAAVYVERTAGGQ